MSSTSAGRADGAASTPSISCSNAPKIVLTISSLLRKW